MPRSVTQLEAGKRGLNMNFDHEELMLMMLYNGWGLSMNCGSCSAT